MPQADTALPFSPQTGQKTLIYGVTRTHGMIQLPTIESADITPKLEAKAIEEFGSQEAAFLYTVMGPGTAKFTFPHTNQRLIDCLVMDQDPNGTQTFVSEELYQPFNIIENFLGMDGKIKGSQLIYGCVADASLSENQKLKDAAAGTLGVMFTNRLRFRGLALQYIRATNGVGPVAQPAAPTCTPANTGGHLLAGEYYVRIAPVSTTPSGAEGIGSIETAVVVGGTNVGDITVTTPAPAGNVATYNVYVGTASGQERYVGNDAGASTYVITAMPSYTASPCPNVDGGTGAYVAAPPAGPGDFVFATKSVTLPVAAAQIATLGLQYALVVKNGIIQASATKQTQTGGFYIDAAGATFNVVATPTNADAWDVIYPFKP